MGIFDNPKDSGQKTADSTRWGPGQVYSNGLGAPDGVGHGHTNPNNGFDRPAVSNFLGNIANKGAEVQLQDKAHTPKW
jgi:hypothetical protein